MPRIGKRSSRLPSFDFKAIEIKSARIQHDVVMRVADFDMPDQSEDSYRIHRGLKLSDEIARYYRIARSFWDDFDLIRESDNNASNLFAHNLLQNCLRFEELEKVEPIEFAERKFPIGYCDKQGRVPIVIAPAAKSDSRKAGVDESLVQFGDESRRSATQLLQAYLNADENALWGIVVDGAILRLLRDNISLTRPSWIEINLEKIFDEGLYNEFAVFWLLVHSSRFGATGSRPSDCSLERWYEEGLTVGSTVREKLRDGFRLALEELGTGLLENSSNGELRHKIQTGGMKRQSFFEELLRLVYRLIFLLVAEDRNLLHTLNAPKSVRETYRRGYSVSRLRDRCTNSSSLNRFCDSWDGLCVLFDALASGESRLGLPALGGLFDDSNLVNIGNSRISNKRLLKAIWHLTWFRSDNQLLTRVNWRDMETEELGSVYESLLELNPVANLETRKFTFNLDIAKGKGNKRKSTGSYYTPNSLVQLLLKTTLDPLLENAESCNPSDPVEEILDLTIIDPACGSGHFLLGAAHRVADRIMQYRSTGSYSQEEYQHALREVVNKCVYGVDRNPMAVELCKVALWIETLEPGKPLSFLDAKIRCGNSLVGVFDPEYQMIRDGLPDDTFDPLTGDDKQVAKDYKSINKRQKKAKSTSGIFKNFRVPESIGDSAIKINAMPENTLKEIKAKSKAWSRLEKNESHLNLKRACDTYVAAYFLPKTGELPNLENYENHAVPTTEMIWDLLRDDTVLFEISGKCTQVALENQVFHWPLEFPAVMSRGGFDCVVGNPPWERIKIQEQEFFSTRDPSIASAPNANARKLLIRSLKSAEPNTHQARLYIEYQEAKRNSEAASVFVRKSGRFPLTGKGDVNTYPLFSELCSRLVCSERKVSSKKQSNQTNFGARSASSLIQGRAGVIVPSGIATDATTSQFFGKIVSETKLAALYDFENRGGLFPDVHRGFRFTIFSIGHSQKARFSAFLHSPHDLEETERRIELETEDFKLMNPNSLTLPLFRARSDLVLTRKLYKKFPIFFRETPEDSRDLENHWKLSFQSMFHMSNDSSWFRTAKQLSECGFQTQGENRYSNQEKMIFVPLLEAKMVHQFDHRFGSYAGLDARPSDNNLPETFAASKADPNYEIDPWYWVPEDEVALRAARVPRNLKFHFRRRNENACLKVLAEWVLGTVDPGELQANRLASSVAHVESLLVDVLGTRVLSKEVLKSKITTWLGKSVSKAQAIQRETPLNSDDLIFMKSETLNTFDLVTALIEIKQPRWLMGWRDITGSTNERTTISSVFPKSATSGLYLIYLQQPARLVCVLLSYLCSLILDYICRQKIAGTHLQLHTFKQLAAPSPNNFSLNDLEFITPRVLELTYTSHSMKQWAEDLGYKGSPFNFDLERRALLKAELDAFYAKFFGLSRDELLYILDPSNIHGEAYPSETFRGLKRNEIKQFGEFRTQRLVLDEFDRLVETSVASSPNLLKSAKFSQLPTSKQDSSHSSELRSLDLTTVLIAFLKASNRPMSLHEIKCFVIYVFESQYLTRLVSEGISSNVKSFHKRDVPEKDRYIGNFFDDISTQWDNNVEKLRADSYLSVDSETGTWSAGEHLESVAIDDKVDELTKYVISVLSPLKTKMVIEVLPNELRNWIESGSEDIK